jgi:hypothetical protein
MARIRDEYGGDIPKEAVTHAFRVQDTGSALNKVFVGHTSIVDQGDADAIYGVPDAT